MRRVAILGATGRTGQLLVGRALDEEFEVNALARNPKHLKRAANALTVYKGDAYSGEGLDALVGGCRYVVSSIGSPRPITSRCMTNLIEQVGHKHLARFIFVSWAGVGESHWQAQKNATFWTRVRFRLLRSMLEDVGKAEQIVRESKLPYVILRPTLLTNHPFMDNLIVANAEDDPPGRLGRADLARFIVRILDEPGWDGREVTIGGASEWRTSAPL
jgi:uncharacterized protein YbjT (DUF2867 family)